MNEFLETILFIKELFEQDSDVVTISHGVSNDIDLEKKTLYPLVYIQALNFNPDYKEGVLKFGFEIHIMSIRDTVKTTNQDIWSETYSELANYNKSVNIANRFLFRLNQNTANDMDLFSNTVPEIIAYDFTNGLDGCKFQIEIITTNNVDICPQ